MMSAATTQIAVITLVPGRAKGRAFVLREPLSFWGGLDSSSGEIIDRWHQQHGETLSGHILVMEAGRGSSSGSSVLAEAIRLGTGPSGIVLRTRDAIVTVGAMIAQELYSKDCPVVLVAPENWGLCLAADYLLVSAEHDRAMLTFYGQGGLEQIASRLSAQSSAEERDQT
jgi:predicted aconitase with swiveling domain